MRRLVLPLLVAFLLAAALPGGGLSQSRPDDACPLLAGQIIASDSIGLRSGPATLNSAELKPATPQATGPNDTLVPEKPAYCEVQGSIAPPDPGAPPIGFQLNLPLTWNGKALQYGGGGFNGVLITGLDPLRDDPLDAPLPLTRGYVTFGTDSGHQASASPPTELAAFAVDDEALTNFAYASYKKVRDVAHAVMLTYYGQPPTRTYYFGGSEGGREGLTMAQRFPEDYDGIVSVVPVINWVGLMHAYFPTQLEQVNGGWISPSKVTMVARAVTDACDDLDGLVDGVVNNYLACPANFNPDKLRCPGGSDSGEACLSDGQIRALRDAHAPYRFPFSLANGVLEYPQWLYGGESTPAGLRQWVIGDRAPDTPVTVDAPRWWLYGGNTIRYLIARDPNFDVRTYDPQNFRERVQQISALMDSTNPDLSAFHAHGGKLILRENAGDYAQSPLAGIRYYSSVVATMGQATADEFLRLYVSPGSNHSGQMRSTTDELDVPTWVDLLDPLDRWVADGQAPEDALIQTRSAAAAPSDVLAARPMCRYPNYPQYIGGDRFQATSYQCAPSTP